jgi:hypothetical protein
MRKTLTEKQQIARAKFYHDMAEAVWLDAMTLVKDYMRHQVRPHAKLSDFPEGGLIAMELASKKILKVLDKAMKESLVS